MKPKDPEMNGIRARFLTEEDVLSKWKNEYQKAKYSLDIRGKALIVRLSLSTGQYSSFREIADRLEKLSVNYDLRQIIVGDGSGESFSPQEKVDEETFFSKVYQYELERAKSQIELAAEEKNVYEQKMDEFRDVLKNKYRYERYTPIKASIAGVLFIFLVIIVFQRYAESGGLVQSYINWSATFIGSVGKALKNPVIDPIAPLYFAVRPYVLIFLFFVYWNSPSFFVISDRPEKRPISRIACYFLLVSVVVFFLLVTMNGGGNQIRYSARFFSGATISAFDMLIRDNLLLLFISPHLVSAAREGLLRFKYEPSIDRQILHFLERIKAI